MTEDRIETIINIEDSLKSAIILHKSGDENYLYDIDEIYDMVDLYIDLVTEYMRECDERLMWYENHIFKFTDTQ